MSIRYECEKCGSVLKIKDDLAGKPGKCPKCKTPFTVPAADGDSASSGEITATESSEDAEPKLPDSRPSDSGADFDLDAFLSGDDDSDVKSKPKAAKTSRPTKALDADRSTLDESDEKPPASRSKSQPDTDDEGESFQIRRGPDAPGKTAPKHGLDGESDEQPTPSRRPPGTNPNAPAANIASDLLAKSAKKGKKANWNEAEPGKKNDEPGFDWDGLWYETRTKLLPVLGGGVVIYLLIYFLVSPMFGDKGYVPKLGSVTGTISVNGKPLVGAQVFFHPADTKQESAKGKSFKITASVGETDATGRYELFYGNKTDKLRGVAPGKCRVEIMPMDPTGISPKYFQANADSPTVDVKPGKQIINLDLSE